MISKHTSHLDNVLQRSDMQHDRKHTSHLDDVLQRPVLQYDQ